MSEGAVPVKRPMGTRMMRTMSGSTKTSLTSLSSHVRHNTDQFTCRGTDNQSPVTESLLVSCLLSRTQKPAESHAVARQLSRALTVSLACCYSALLTSCIVTLS